jgi:PadR family transcriptional regulator, regulatory protein PadR
VGQSSASAGWNDPPHCRFELAPPRHFVYPAILLLLSEKPRHGYRLIDPLSDLGFGPADRPTVYRALADLERDGLLESWDAEPKAGATRHVYALTEAGRAALDRWMQILADERDRLDAVLDRYALLDQPPRLPSRPSDEPPTGWPPPPVHLTGRATTDEAPAAGSEDTVSPDKRTVATTAFEVVPDQSAIMIRARSNVGTIEFGTTGLRGRLEAVLRAGSLFATSRVAGRVEVDIAELTSGNSLYDAELRRRVDARAYPVAVLELDDARPLSADRFEVGGRLTFHGASTTLDGAVGVTVLGAQRLVVSGEKVIDIRDFQLAAPTMLMLRIYPDVRVFLHLEAEAVTTTEPQA